MTTTTAPAIGAAGWEVVETCGTFLGPTLAGQPCAMLVPPARPDRLEAERWAAWRWVPLAQLLTEAAA